MFTFSLVSFSLNAYGQVEVEREAKAKTALEAAMRKKNPAELAEAYYLMAKVASAKLNIAESNEWLLKAIRMLEKRGPSHDLGRNYMRIGINYMSQRNRPDAIKYNNIALAIFKASGSKRGEMLAYGLFASIYGQHWQDIGPEYDKAITYYELTEKLSLELNDQESLNVARFHLGQIEAMKKGTSFLPLLQSRVAHQTDSVRRDQVMYSLDLASNLIKENKLSEALKLIEMNGKIIKVHFQNNAEIWMHLEKAYADYFVKTGQYQRALVHLGQYHTYHTKALLEDRDGAVSSLNIKFETQKKEAELQQRKLELRLKDERLKNQQSYVERQGMEIERKNDSIAIHRNNLEKQAIAMGLKDENLNLTRRFLIVVGLLLCFTALLSLVLYRLFRKNKAISHRNAILVHEQNHRVKNNLQIVSSLLSLQANMLEDTRARTAVDETQLRIESMVVLHRQLYDNQNLDKIDMDLFIAHLVEIILQTYSYYGVEPVIKVSADPVPADKAVLLGLMINELITNCCKYAFAGHPAPALEVLFEEMGENYQLVVKDNGLREVRIDEKESGSFGFKLIRMMVSQLDGSYACSYSGGLEFNMIFRR